MKLKAVPTHYAGVRFRSRLEAKWAALFDIAGWNWEYEPLDLDGYIPDFILRLQRPVLVEVKPFIYAGDEEEEQDLAHAKVKLDLSGWDGEAWIVGAIVANDQVGHFREEMSWGPAGVYACNDCGNKTPFHHDLSWMCRFCGSQVSASWRMQHWDIVADLRAAANEVQWKAA